MKKLIRKPLISGIASILLALTSCSNSQSSTKNSSTRVYSGIPLSVSCSTAYAGYDYCSVLVKNTSAPNNPYLISQCLNKNKEISRAETLLNYAKENEIPIEFEGKRLGYNDNVELIDTNWIAVLDPKRSTSEIRRLATIN